MLNQVQHDNVLMESEQLPGARQIHEIEHLFGMNDL